MPPLSSPRILTKTLHKQLLSCPRKSLYLLSPSLYPPSPPPPILSHLSAEAARFRSHCLELYPSRIPASSLPPSRLLSLTSPPTAHPPYAGATLLAATCPATCPSGPLLAAVDLLLFPDPARVEVLAVRSRSYRSASGLRTKKGSLAAKYRGLVQDLAFQAYLAGLCYPGRSVGSFLLLPDAGKALEAGGSAAARVDVTEDVRAILASPAFPALLARQRRYLDEPEEAPAAPSAACGECVFRARLRECVSPGEPLAGSGPLSLSLRGSRRHESFLPHKPYLSDLVPGVDYDLPSPSPPPGGFTAADLHHLQATSSPPALNLPYLAPALAGLTPPYHYLDFETASPCLPLSPGFRPYQLLPFQFSLHVSGGGAALGELRHTQFVDTTSEDPAPRFKEALGAALGGGRGSIVHWGKFERTVLEKLGFGEDVLARLVDLSVLVKKG
ncbi:hypothetical protein TeGR_g2609, partial [Tetraparma gracilis]